MAEQVTELILDV